MCKYFIPPVILRTVMTLAVIFFCIQAQSAIISGQVTDENNQPLPYANVYIRHTTQGATANAEGKYQLTLQPGQYELVYSYVGYLQTTKMVVIVSIPVVLNVQLRPDKVELKEVIVTAGGEDPAYRVIRAAIKQRSYYLNQIHGFSCDVYIKGVVRLDSTPKRIMGYSLEKKGIDSTALGIIYLSESESQYYFQQPDRVKEIMLSSKVSGDAAAFSWNKASDFDFNFYKNLVDAGLLSNRQFISPIAETALLYYRYRLTGTFYEDHQLVNKIEVIPRRKGDAVFNGYIYIVEDSWRIHSTDLRLNRDANLDFVDSLRLAQTYAIVDDSTWMPYSQTMDVGINALGFRMKAKFAGVFTQYLVNPSLPDKFFSGEVWKINEDANKRDSIYWITNRQVPLTEEEADDYHEKDSLSVIQHSKIYLDSADRANNKFAAADLIFGFHYYRRSSETAYNTSGLLSFINYNTVEGFAPAVNFSMIKHWEDKRALKVGSSLRYGISNHKLSARVLMRYLFDPASSAAWRLEGGHFAEQFNDAGPISPLINTIYTLFAGENYMKLFMNDYVKGSITREVINGIQLTAGTSYNHRTELTNTTALTFAEPSGTHFTANEPQFAFNDSTSYFNGYNAWLINVKATVHFKQRYYSRPNEKIIIGSKYPSLSVAYTRGLPWIGSSLNFDQLEITVDDHYKLGTFGEGDYQMTGGAFITNDSVGAVELKHFEGNQTIFARSGHLNAYQLLPYYTYSTNQWYLQGHLEHHFQGLLMNHIPLIRKLKLQEVAGVHYLQTPDLQYAEISFGMEHIFKLIRLDYVAAYSSKQHITSGLVIGLTLGVGGVVTVSVDE